MKAKLKRYLNSLVFRNIVTFLVILAVVVVPMIYVYLKDVENLISDRISVQLGMVAQLGNYLLNADEVAQIRNMIWYETPEYEHLVKTLGEIQRTFDVDNAVVYRRLASGRFVYVADGNRQFPINAPVTLHEEFPGTYQAASEAWNSGLQGDTRLFTSGHSKWFQVNMPLKSGGRVVAVLMLNKFATPIAAAISQRQQRIILGMSLALAGGIFVWWFLTTRQMRPLIRLTNASREIAAGNLDIDVPQYESASEVGTLNGAFVKMVEDLRASRAQIEEHNRTLEQRIEERTREIRSLLDNMDEAILSIDPQGSIHPGYSQATGRLFAGIAAGDDLYGRLTGEEGARQLLRDTFALLVGGELQLDWGDMVANLPAEFDIGQGRTVHARYRPVYDADGARIERVMVILTDVSKEKALQADIHRTQSLQDMVLRIIQNRETYELFYEDSLELLGRGLGEVAQLEQVRRGVVDELFRTMHTIKGTAAVFGLSDLAEKAHQVEDVLRDLGARRDKPFTPARREALAGELEAVRELLIQSRRTFLELIGEEEGEPTHGVTETKLRRIEQDIVQMVPPQAAPRFRRVLDELRRVPTARLLRKYRSMVETLGGRLGKPVRFALEDRDETEIPPAFFKKLDATFLHVLRNAIDHGIEESEARMEAGKEPEATISVSAAYKGEGLAFTIRDDGQGIDVERIRAIAVERGFVSAEQAAGLSREAVLALLFEPRFSSRATVSDLSGRGVGLDVVRTDVEQLGGRMRLTTRKGLGTTFRLYFPLPA